MMTFSLSVHVRLPSSGAPAAKVQWHAADARHGQVPGLLQAHDEGQVVGRQGVLIL